MANILERTEEFDHAYWTAFDGLVVTADTHVAPWFAGISAGMADTIADTSGVNFSSLFSTFETIPNDSSEWIASVFLRKDADTSRFPALAVQFQGGTNLSWGIAMNTSTGTTWVYDSPGPTDFAVVDYDALWWRIWINPVNNSSGNTQARVAFYPAAFNIEGGGANGGVTGSAVYWGVNLTNTTAIADYEPDPFYTFTAPGAPVTIATFLQ